jgi:hypothetical protein
MSTLRPFYPRRESPMGRIEVKRTSLSGMIEATAR